jgi:DNA-directed RNA polymerase subunit RPC12/RpoP
MATTALAITTKIGDADTQRQAAAEPTTDNAQVQTGDEAAKAVNLSEDMQRDLIEVRRKYKQLYLPKRNLFLRRALRAFEVLKNNPYILYNETTADYDSLAMILQGTATKEDVDLYQYQDNIYQMLALSFIAALSNDNTKIRYQPVNAQDEEDIAIAKKASTIHAYNERRNGIEALQQLELLYIWCTGSYFCRTYHVIDRNRAGVSRQDITTMQQQEAIPARYICPSCGAVTPESKINPYGVPKCPKCGSPLGQQDWYEPQMLPMPVIVGEIETPNGMTAFNVYSGLNVDVDPDQNDLYDCPILDLEVEVPLAAVRAAFPAMYSQIQENATGDGTEDGEMAKRTREMVTSPTGVGPAMVGQSKGTYSRCWIQPDAFYILEDQARADALKEAFPEGARLATYAGDMFLQAVPESMMTHWSHAGSLKGLGMYPFGAGDAALEIQSRINDAANIIHAYLDRMAFGTILADSSAINVEALDQKSLIAGNITAVERTDEDSGTRIPLSDILFQPEFHVDSKIYEYEPNLVQLAQVISGVQPQVFGGSDPNVQTFGGQKQALNTATGRLMLYLKRIREERAARAKNSVMCSVDNMDDEMRLVMDGETDGDYRTEVLLKNELTGEFLTYPETEEGFPSTYQEIQQRITELLTQGAKSPFLATLLSDPDTMRVVARYILPDEIKLPGDAERARIKTMLHQMSESKPAGVQPGPNGQPVVIPSMMPNPDYDDLGMCVVLAKSWLQQNWQMAESPQRAAGFTNVLAFLRVCTMMNAFNQAKAQIVAQQAAGGAPGGPGGPGQPPPQGHPQFGPGGPPPPPQGGPQ